MEQAEPIVIDYQGTLTVHRDDRPGNGRYVCPKCGSEDVALDVETTGYTGADVYYNPNTDEITEIKPFDEGGSVDWGGFIQCNKCDASDDLAGDWWKETK